MAFISSMRLRPSSRDLDGLLETGGDVAVDLFDGAGSRVDGRFGHRIRDFRHQRNLAELLGQVEQVEGAQEPGFTKKLIAELFVLHLVQAGDGHVGAGDAGIVRLPELQLGVGLEIEEMVVGLDLIVVLAAAAETLVGHRQVRDEGMGAGLVGGLVQGSIDTRHKLHGIICGCGIVTCIAFGVADRVQEFIATGENNGSQHKSGNIFDGLFHGALELKVDTYEEGTGAGIVAQVDAGHPVFVEAVADFRIHPGVLRDGQEVLSR